MKIKYKHSKETRKRMSENRKGEKHPFYGCHHTEETKQKMSESHSGENHHMYGKTHTKEAIHKIKIARAKQVFPEGTNKKRSETQKGRIFSEESKEKMRQHALKRFSDKKNHPFYGIKRPEVGLINSKKFKGITYDERHGKKKSAEIRKKLSDKRATQIFPKQDTKIELKIQGFLEELQIEYIKHFYMKYIKSHYRCDIFIPSLNLVIECDGDWWHGNPSFYDQKELTIKQKEQKIRDRLRTDQLKQHGFKVIRLWEDDIKELDIIKFQQIIQ